MRNHEIHKVIAILKKEVRQWKIPVVGAIAEETHDPFKVLISCLLSLRTQDSTTDAASNRLFELAETPTEMLRLSPRTIEKAIYPVGFYRTKAKSIHTICRDLIDRFGGEVPDSIEALLTLKGVGRKTANLVVTVGFGKPGICVDTHVHRISNRMGYVRTRTPEQTETALRTKLPHRYWIIYNDLLVPFGQNLCRPLAPHCSRCQIAPYCDRV
ncbi:MAG TPA: endonuclease III, partial [Nitrospiria bacterium]|nr:endonuclease III [Nitrospiria bacterium]